MKNLAITICFLLLIPPAVAQQITGPGAASFYVPYAVPVSSPPPLAGECSLDDQRAAWASVLPSAPQRYPIRRGYPGFGGRMMGYPPPGPPSARAALIVTGAVVVTILLGVVNANSGTSQHR